MFKTLNDLFKKQDAAQTAVSKEIARLYPVGTKVSFHKGRGSIVARVMMFTSFGDSNRLKVENVKTGKEYWIHIGMDYLPEILETL